MAGRESLPRWGQSFNWLAAASIFSFMVAGGCVALLILDRQLSHHFKQATADSAALVAGLVEQELQSTAERARFAVSAALKSSDENRAAALPLFEGVTALAGVTVYQRGESDSGPVWTPLFHWPRPAGDPHHWSEKEFRAIERSFPIHFDLVEKGELDLASATGPKETPVLRLATPFGQQALVLELLADRIGSILRSSKSQFVFIAGRDSRLLGESKDGHFVWNEDLSALPILREAMASTEVRGTTEYQEVPGAEIQYASYVRTPHFTLVSQVPRSQVTQVIWGCGWVLMVVAFGAALFGGIAAGMQRGLMTGLATEDESEQEPALAVEKVDASPRVTPAVLMCARVRGLDSVSDQLKPKKAKELFESLRGEIRAQIEARGGTVHSWSDGADEWGWVASWTPQSGASGTPSNDVGGVSKNGASGGLSTATSNPDAGSDWASPAIDACVELRSVIQSFNQSALGKKWFGRREPQAHTEIVVSLHAGEVTLKGQSVSGAPLDLGARLEALARHIGTDLLISSAVKPHLSDHIALESAISGDDDLPELFELVGIDGARPDEQGTTDASDQRAA